MSQVKMKKILDMIDNLQENLLSLPDDMLLSIDPRDNESLEKGSKFIIEFNDNLDIYVASSAKIADQIKAHFSIDPEEEEVEKEAKNKQKRDRIIKELDKTLSHTLEENFTYKRPYGFVLEDSAYKGLKTWRNLFIKVLDELEDKDIRLNNKLPEEEKFISKRGNFLFSRDKSKLRYAKKLNNDFYVELNLSANHIRDIIIDLLKHFQMEPNDMKIYLREDRDAYN